MLLLEPMTCFCEQQLTCLGFFVTYLVCIVASYCSIGIDTPLDNLRPVMEEVYVMDFVLSY